MRAEFCAIGRQPLRRERQRGRCREALDLARPPAARSNARRSFCQSSCNCCSLSARDNADRRLPTRRHFVHDRVQRVTGVRSTSVPSIACSHRRSDAACGDTAIAVRQEKDRRRNPEHDRGPPHRPADVTFHEREDPIVPLRMAWCGRKRKKTVIMNRPARKMPIAIRTPSCVKPAEPLSSRARNPTAVVRAPKKIASPEIS